MSIIGNTPEDVFTITADVLIVFPRIDDMDAVVLRGAGDLQYILLTIAGDVMCSSGQLKCRWSRLRPLPS